MRKTLLCVLLLVCAAASAQQTEVTYSDDFQSYGSPKNAPGWVDTAVGNSKPEAAGLYKTWPDPTQGNKATNIVYGSKSASGQPEHSKPRIGHFSTLTTKSFNTKGRFEYRGRFLRTATDARLGLSFLSSYPEKDSYYLIGLWSVQGSPSLTMQLLSFGAGTPAGTTASSFTPAANTWYRFLIQVDDVAGATKIRARFWPDGSPEPTTFSIDATDSAATRLTAGRIGVWAAVKGANYFDDLFAKSPVDHTAPVITFSEGGVVLPPNTVTPLNHDARVDVRATDDLSGVATVTATVDGQPYTPLTPITAEGPHVIAARAVDNVGNASTSETSVLVDKTEPVITLMAGGVPLPLPASSFKTVPSIVITASDQWTGATFVATLDGQPYTWNTPITVEGTHHLLVEATDGVKNKRIVQATILVDLGAPAIEFYEKGVKLTSPSTFKYDPAIEIRLVDAHSTPTYTATLETGADWKSLDPMPTGWHKLTVNAVDGAGNTSTASLDVLVDKDAPVIVLREAGKVLDPAVRARYKEDFAVEVGITDATSAIKNPKTELNSQSYQSGTLITVEKNTHTLTVHAEDEAGNVTDVTLSILLDKTPPVIAFSEGGGKLDERELQKFRADAAIRIDVTDVVSTATYDATLTTPARGTSGKYTSGTPVTVEDTHAILVKAVDEAGNIAESTLNLLVDKTVPSIAFSAAGKPLDTTKETPFGEDVAVDIIVTDNLPGVAYTAKLDGADYTTGTPITTDGPHVVTVHAVDAAENTLDREVKVLVDKTGPTIAFFESNGELDMARRHDFNRLPSIEIRVADALSTVTSSATITVPGGTAEYKSGTEVGEGYRTITVRAEDARGHVTVEKIDLLVDVTKPVVVLKDKQTGNDLPLSGMIFNRDVTVDAVITDVSKTTTDATLDGKPFSLSVPVSQEGLRTVEVIVTDELGWKTPVSTAFTVDKTAPVLKPTVTVDGESRELLSGDSFARPIAITVPYDDITKVDVTATIDGQTYVPGQPYSTDGTHTLVVNAVDAAGNRSQTITLTFYIDKNAPEVSLILGPLEGGVPFPQGKTFDRAVVISVKVAAATSSNTVEATIDGQEYTPGTSYATEGNHRIKVVVTNVARLKTTVEADFTIDYTPPTVKLRVKHGEKDEDFVEGMKFGTDILPYTVVDDNLSKPPRVVMTLNGQELPAGTTVSEEEFHAISATATDDAGHSTPAGPFNFVIDKTPPVVTVKVDGEPLVDGAQFNKTITPAIDAEDLTAPVYTITLKDSETSTERSYTRGTPIEADADYTLVVGVKDDLGNASTPLTIHFTIDKTPPVVRVLDKETNAPFTGGKFKRAVTPIVQVDDLTDTLTNATVLNRTTNEESPWSSGQEISSDGHYTLKVTVTDELQWVTPVPPIEFTIDKAAPVITVTEAGLPLVTETIFNRDARPKITVDDTTVPKIEAKLGDQEFISETLVTREARHTLTVKATDELGLVGEILPIVFTVDKTKPVVTVFNRGVLLTDNALLDDDAVPDVRYEDLTAVEITMKVDGQPFTLGNSVSTEGPHTLDVTVVDAAKWETIVPTIRFTVDKTDPVVRITVGKDGPPLGPANEFKETITPWVHVTDITATDIKAKLNGVDWTHNTPLAEEKPYVLEVTVTDAVGHVTVVGPIAFIIDKSAPKVELFESGKAFVTGTKLDRPAQLTIEIDDLTRTETVARVGETSFTFPGTVDRDGRHTLTVTVTDNLGHPNVVPPVEFIVDQTPPVVAVSENGVPLESGKAFDRNVKPEIKVTDLTAYTVAAKLNGASYEFGTEVTAEGVYTLTATVTDDLGWVTEIPAIVFYIDRTKPVVTLMEGDNELTDGLWFNRPVAPRAKVEDTTAYEKTATLARDGGAAEAYTLETPITAEGKYTLNVTVTDAVGLKTEVGPITFTIDTTPPAITITYPALNATLTTPRIVVIGDSDDAVSVTVNEVETTIDPAEKKYATNGAIDLLEGENTLVAFGIDRAGNNTTITQVVQLDTRAPELSITAPAANACFNTRTVQVTGTIADSNVAGIRVAYTPGTAAPVDATRGADGRTWSATLTLPSQGRFVITATGTDASAHQALASVTVSVDETRPRIEITSGGAPIPQFTNRTLAPVARVVDADAKAALTVTLDGAVYVSGTPIAAEKIEPYELKATATDCAGNKSDETIVRFVIDKTPPQFLTLAPANGAFIGEVAPVSGSVSPDTVSVVAEGHGTANVTNGAFAFAALPVADGVNRFTLFATDRAGNVTRFDYSFRVKTSAPNVEIVENGSPIVNGARYTRPVTVDVRSNEADATISATHNGQLFTSGGTISAGGSHTVAATARDSFGHSSSATVTFTIDLTGPVVTITEPADGAAVTTDRVRVRGTISGDPVSATINNLPLALTGDAFDTEVALDFGANDIVVTALDAAGNAGQASIEVTRGGGTAGLILNSPQHNTLTNRRTTTVAGQVLSPAGVTHVTVNGIGIPIDAAGAFRKTDFALSEGQNVITATVSKGTAQGTVSVTVTGDFTPPVVTVRESGNVLEDEARFASRAEITVEAADGGQSLTPTVLIDAAPATSPVTVTTNGGHTLLAVARDAAGNERRVERTFFIGAGGTGACALTDFDPANNSVVTANTVTLVGRTGGAAGVKVNGSAATVASGSFSATVNLPVEGANVITIVCTDAAGNAVGNPATLTLTRVTGAPSITISTPADDSVTGEETITVTGTLAGEVSSVTVNGSAATVNGNSFTATNVRLASGVNVIVARARNAAGRTSSDSIRVTWLKNPPTVAISSPAVAITTGASTLDVSGVWTNLDPSSITVAGTPAQAASTSDTTGTFIAPSVSLTEGLQTITVRGVDRLGRIATAGIQVTRVTDKPSLTITEPADNSWFAATATNFPVRGTFTAKPGATIEVNGVVADIDPASSTFNATISFSTAAGGLTPVVARVTEPAGDSAIDTLRVNKLAAAPRVVQSFPEANTVDVNAGALPLVLFSASMDRASVRDAVRLENAAGSPVTGEITLDRDVVTFAPAVLLEAGERYTIRVSTAAKDLAGNALAQAFSSSFTIAATAPATAPTLNAYATRACAELTLSGTAPAGARVRIELGTLAFNTNASGTGAFSYKLPLSGRGGFQVARVRVVGSDGSLSPAAEAQFEVDCAGPHVTDATYDRTANVLTITFSKPIDPATVTATGATASLRLQLPDGTLVGGTATLSTPSIVSLTPAQNLGAANFTLTVTTAVKDTNGGALSSAYSRPFSIGEEEPGDGSGYIAGEIFDAATGRPLPGASVTIDVPVGAFGRTVRAEAVRPGDVGTTSAVTAVADNRGRYVRALPEGAHTIRASAEGYTTVWRQIIVRAGVGVIPTDIRLTPRGATANGTGAALVLTDGGVGEKPLSRVAELRIPGGVVTASNQVTLTSLGAQSLPGLLPLGWSPLASAEIVSNATSLSGSQLVFDVPKDDLTAAAQTLTAVRYHEDRDEWRVIDVVSPVSTEGKATIAVAAPGAYALVYPDKAPHLTSPRTPAGGAVLPGVTDPCSTATCPPLVAKNALELTPPVVLPTQRTVATLRIEGAGTSLFPSGTAVQAYVDEELHLADGSRDVVSPFVTDLLLYRSLTGDTGEAAFHLAPSGRAAEVVLEVGYDHIRILPYPERLDRGALIGPEGGRVPGDDRVAVEIPAGATAEALKATASTIQDFARFGTIPGYRIVGGLSLTLQWAAQTAGVDATAVELLKPARATFTVTDSPLPSQLVLAEVVEGTLYGRIYRLAAQMTALDGGGRFSTKTIDRAVLPVDGIIREGSYLLLAPNAPIAFATGTVRLGQNASAVAGARVLTPPLGVVDLTRMTGIFNVPVPASAFTLIPRTIATGDGAAYNHPSASVDQVINVGALSLVSQPPTVSLTVFSHQESGLVEVPAAGAKGVSPTTSVKATFAPGVDPASVGTGSITVVDDSSGGVVPGRAVAQGNAAILWTLEAGTRLRPDATYTALVSGGVRGTNGTPLGTPVSASFSTVSAVYSTNVDPSKIRITIPDANGRSSIIGAPGALKEHWNAVAVRQGRDFSTRPQDTADSLRQFRIELGTSSDPNDRVTIADKIYLQIINEAGSVAAIIPLGAFTSEDGRGFVARPDEETVYTTPDNITLTVPEGAFDVATLVSVHPAPKSAIAGVPRFDEELTFHAGFKIDFEGIAKERLDITFPIPASLPADKTPYLGYYGQSVRGPRIMLIDFLRREGENLTTRDPQPSSLRTSTQSAGRVSANAIVNPQRDMVLGIDRGSILTGFTFNTGTAFITIDPPSLPLDFFVPPIESMYYASFAAERGRLLVPVPAGVPYRILGVDPGSGQTVIDAPYDAVQPGEPSDAGPVVLPSTNDFGPYPVFISPGRTDIIDLNSDPMEDRSIRNLIVAFKESTLRVKNDPDDKLPEKTHVGILNLTTGDVLRYDDFATSGAGDGISMPATLGDRIVILIGQHDVDPEASVLTVVFNEPIKVGSAEDMQKWFGLWVADPTLPGPLAFKPVTGTGLPNVKSDFDVTSDSGGRRISIIHPGSFQRGKVYRLVLSDKITDRDTFALALGQKKDGGIPGELWIEFAVREPSGLLGTFHLPSGGVRDLAKSGNVLLVSALQAGIVAYDVSDPAKVQSVNPDSTTPTPPVPMSKVLPPPGTDSQTWALATDDHGRVYATALSPMYGVVRSYRIEDFYCTSGCPKTLGQPAQKGNAIIAWRTGINVGVPLAAMIVGGWPEATPRKMQIVTKDTEPDEFDFPPEPFPGPGASDSNGFRKHTVTVEMTPGFPYGEQRVTVTNLTRGYRWSEDVSGSHTFEIVGKAGDKIRVVKNLTTFGVISLFGHGIGTYDLNAVEANYRNVLNPEWERLADTVLVDTGDGGKCGLNAPCERPARIVQGKECPIADLVYAPDAALVGIGSGLGVFALDQNRGVLQLNVDVAASASCARSGSLIFQERVNMFPPYGTGRAWAGHPRLNRLRRLFREATGRDPSVRYTSMGTYRRGEQTYLLVAGNELGLLVAKVGAEPLTRDSLVDVVWIPGGAYSVRVNQEDNLAVVVDGKKRVLLVNLAQIDESGEVEAGNVTCGGLDCEAELYPTVSASISAIGPPPGSPPNTPPTVPVPINENGVGHDDPRILWKSAAGLVSGTLAPIVDNETGFVYTGDVLTRKLNIVSAIDPKIRFIGIDGGKDGTDLARLRELDRVVPLGIELPKSGIAPGLPSGTRAAFQVLVSLPGSMAESLGTPSIHMAVESERVVGATTAQTPEYLPPAHLRQHTRAGKKSERNVTFALHHDAPVDADPNLRFQRGWNRMVSKWVVAIADPRAADAYDWGSSTTTETQKAEQGCFSCKRPDFVKGLLGVDWYELYTTGRFISVRPEVCGNGGDSDCPGSATSIFGDDEDNDDYTYLGDDKRRLETRIATTMADTVRPVQALTAAHGAPAAVGSHLETYMVHSGEVVNSTVDLDAGGRAGWNVVLDRTYRSRTLGFTPLGYGWDSSIFQRLRQLPNTDVEYRDGSGEVWRFKANKDGYYTTPDGLDVKLSRYREGWRMTDAKQRITDFDELGRLTLQADEFYELGTNKGNVISYSYRADGLLDRIVDPVGRDTELEYENGQLKRVEDWRDREVAYDVDSVSWLLDEVKLPRVRGLYSNTYDYTSDSSRPKQQYKYIGGTEPADAEVATNLKEIIEPGDDTNYRVKFEYQTDPAQRDMIKSELWGTADGAKSTFEYTLASSGVPVATQAIVHDALEQKRTYKLTVAATENPYAMDRVHTSTLIEDRVRAWNLASFGTLPPDVTIAGSTFEEKDRTWTFKYLPKTNPATGADNPPALRGRLDETNVEYDGQSVVTKYEWDDLTPAGAVLMSRKITSSAGGMEQSYTYTGGFLDTVTNDGQTVESKEARRSPEPIASTDGGVTTETTFDENGLVNKVVSTGDGAVALDDGSKIEIKYHDADDEAKYRRGLPYWVDQGGIWTDVAYPDSDKYSVVFNRIGRSYSTTKQYDEAGNLLRIGVTGEGSINTEEMFAYDARGRLLRHRRKQKEGKYIEDRYTYDRVDRVVKHEKYEGSVDPTTLVEATELKFQLPIQKIETTLSTGATVEETLDGLGRVQDRRVDPKNPNMADASGMPTVITERLRYDLHGNLVFRTDGLTATGRSYDGAHRLKETLTSGDVRTETKIDGFGRVQRVKDVNTGFVIENQFTPGGKLQFSKNGPAESRYTWDGAGRPRTATVTAGFGLPNPLRYTIFDEAGRIESTRFGEGVGLDTFARIYEGTEWSYGTTDHPVSIKSMEDGSANTYTHTPTYDALGRPTKVTTGGAEDMTIEHKFDLMGNVTYVKSPEQPSATEYEYDGRGLMTQEKLPDPETGLPTSINQFDYAKSGALEKYTDPTGEPTKTKTDGLGRPYERTYADTSTEQIFYEYGRVLKTKDRQSRWQHFVYEDQSGRPLKVLGDGGVVLDELGYDSQGRLTSWKTSDTLIEFGNFDAANRPQLTKQTRYRADGAVLDSYSQTHTYDHLGRRLSWTMPNGAALGPGWVATVRPRYDAAGNIVKIERDLNGLGLVSLLAAEFRATGRPKHRTLTVNPASPSPFTIKREYDYEPSAGRMNAFRVFSGSTLMAGSEVTFKGTQLESAKLLGLANGGRTLTWDYDKRGRLISSIAASGDPSAGASTSSLSILPKLNDADFLEKVSTSGSSAPVKEFKETADGHKVDYRDGDPAKKFEYNAVDGLPGGVRTKDDRFLYEFDEKERLVKVTQRPTGAEGSIYRIVYTYSGLGRMIGRRAEIAPATGTLDPPANGAFRPALPLEIGPDAGLPPETTFVWDPISDQMVAAFDTATGAPIRQFIHGGMGLDDPIEVTVGETGGPARYYPIYDEAGDGGLQVILSETGKIVTRTIISDPYGDGEISLSGAAVQTVTLTRSGDGMNVEVEFTEPIESSTLGTGMRLASITSGNEPTIVTTSSVAPELTGGDNRTVRWSLNAAQWAELTTPTGAFSLSVAVTNALRASTYTPDAPVMPANTTLRSGVFASVETPFELHETFGYIQAQVTGSTPYTAYRLTSLVGAGTTSASGGSSANSVRASAEVDSGAVLLMAASFQAQSFTDPFTQKNYVRARWYDPSTGSWLSPDPEGYIDSANLYSFAGGDPVNGRDPTGEATVSVSRKGNWVIAGKNGGQIIIDAWVAAINPLIVQDALIEFGGMIPYQAKGLMRERGLRWTHDHERPYEATPELPSKGKWGYLQGTAMSFANGATGSGVALANPNGDARGLQFTPTSREQEISKGVTDIVLTLLFLRTATKHVAARYGSPASVTPGRVSMTPEKAAPRVAESGVPEVFEWRLPGEVPLGSPLVRGHHNAIVAIVDGKGLIRMVRQLSSAGMTIFESLWPKWKGLSSHTEARIVTRIPLAEGEKMIILGQDPPCASCKGYMNRAAKTFNADITYQWWENGQLKTWQAKKK